MIWPKLLHPVSIPLFLSVLATINGPGGLFELAGDPTSVVPAGSVAETAVTVRADLADRLMPGGSSGAPPIGEPDEVSSLTATGPDDAAASTAILAGDAASEDTYAPAHPAGAAGGTGPPTPVAGGGPPSAGNPTPVPTPTNGAGPRDIARFLYLRNNPLLVGDTLSTPVLPLLTAAPTLNALYNCDTNRDAFPGLLIAKGANGAAETDPTKYQSWRTAVPTSPVAINGTVTLTVWSAMQDFNTVKSGRLTVFLRDFNGVSHTNIAQGSLAQPNWSGGSSSWVEKTVTIPAVNYTLPAGHQLEIKLIVDSGSADDMWFAYDTVSYASRLQLP